MENQMKKYYQEKFGSPNTSARVFLSNIRCEISELDEKIWSLYDEDDECTNPKLESKYEEIIRLLQTEVYCRGNVGLNFKLLSEYMSKNDVDDVFWIEPIKKANLEGIKTQIWDNCLGYSDATSEEEIAYENEMIEAYEQIKTVKALKQWVKDYGIPHYGLQIWKGHLVDALK